MLRRDRDRQEPVVVVLPAAEQDEAETVWILRGDDEDQRFLLDPLAPSPGDATASQCARTVYDDMNTGQKALATLGFTYWRVVEPRGGRFVVAQWEIPQTDRRNRRLLARVRRQALQDDESIALVGDAIARACMNEELSFDRGYLDRCLDHIREMLKRRESRDSRRRSKWRSR